MAGAKGHTTHKYESQEDDHCDHCEVNDIVLRSLDCIEKRTERRESVLQDYCNLYHYQQTGNRINSGKCQEFVEIIDEIREFLLGGQRELVFAYVTEDQVGKDNDCADSH